jgi:hypothetical protein
MKFMYASGAWYASAITIGWVTIAVTLIVGVPTLLVWWSGIRKRLLVYTVEWTSLLLKDELESSGVDDIEIILRGQSVDNPHLVTLAIASRSRKDIRTEDFDSGKSLLFHLGVPIVAAKSVVFKDQSTLALGEDIAHPGLHGTPSKTIQIKPCLVRKGPWCQLHLLTTGPPDVKYESPIANVTVRRGSPATSKLIYVAIGALAGCLLFEGEIEGEIIANPHPGWLEVVIAIVLLLAATVIGGELVKAWRQRPS